MRPFLLFMALAVFLCSDLKGQSLAVMIADTKDITTYSTSNFTHFKDGHKANTLTTVGRITLAVGITTAACGGTLIGFDYDFGAERVDETMRNRGRAFVYVGASLMAAGLGMIIAGNIRSSHSLSIVSPKSNEVGIAYNFRPSRHFASHP